MISLRPEHLKRYKELAVLLIKYGRSDLVKGMGIKIDWPIPHSKEEPQILANELSDDLQRLGPTYIKIGQLLSTQTDFLPDPYEKALMRLQDDIEPFAYEEVEKILTAELGLPVDKAFQSFDPEPIAAASLGQVHKATLFDGRVVAVKVQRPNITQTIAEDMEVLLEMAHVIDKSTLLGPQIELTSKVEEFQQSLQDELDYNREKKSLATIGENLRKFKHIVIPQPVDSLCTSRVLTMDYIHGTRLTELSPEQKEQLDGPTLAAELFKAYLRQILVDGLVHLDPHLGNVYVTADLQKLLVLDLGMTGRMAPRMQTNLVKLLFCISDERGEDAADIVFQLGHQSESFDLQRFREEIASLVSRYAEASLEELSVGQLVLQINRTSQDFGNVLPKQFIMLAKTLVKLDQVGKELDKSFNPNASIRRNANDLMLKRMSGNISLMHIYQGVLETTQFIQTLPSKIGMIMDTIARNELRLHVDAIDENMLLNGLQKIANRITIGLILASIIVGAAIMMDIQSPFTIFGYPGLAILLFSGAAVGGVALILAIIYYDR